MTESPAATDTIVYKTLQPSFASSLAIFHSKSLGGKLTWLGPAYIKFFYEMALKQTDAFGWVALRGEEIVGFVFGSVGGENITGRVVRENIPRWLIQSIRGVLTHPFHALRIAVSLYRNRGSTKTAQPELHYIAVRENQRGQHIGKQLLIRFCQDLATRGQAHYELSVAQQNRAAISFYENNGGRAVEDYTVAGMKMRRFLFRVESVLSRLHATPA